MTDHFVRFEYGTGQVWGCVRARSAADIAARIPEVDVVSGPPSWMSDGQVRALRERAAYASSDALDAILHRRSPAV